MQAKIVGASKVALPVVLLFFHIKFFGAVAYIPQTLRECISVVYEEAGSQYRKQALGELYVAIRENRMLTSDAVARRGVKEALEYLQASPKRSKQGNMIEYLEQFLKNLNDTAVLLTMDGDAAQMRSWPLGLIERSMRDQIEAYDLLRLSNELSDNLIFCGSEADGVLLDSQAMSTMWSSQKRSSVIFKPNVMTNSQSINPSIVLGGTGVGSTVINGWALSPAGILRSVDFQSPVTIQFVIPDDFDKDKPVSLELGFLVLNNGLADGYANFLVQAKYLRPKHSFNPDDINWTHSNSSGNVKITEASNPDNVKYMFVSIPLTRSYIKPQYFAFLSISRILPTGGKSEYTGDLALVSAVFKYKSSTE